MSDFNWSSIEQSIPSKRTRYEYDRYAPYFKKVAFDCYKANNGSEQLWELRDGEDGKKYLYALYGDAEDIVAESKKDWQASADADGKNVTLAYRQVPIYRFASSQYGYQSEQADEFAEFVESKARDTGWVNELLSKAMSEERRRAVLKLIEGEV